MEKHKLIICYGLTLLAIISLIINATSSANLFLFLIFTAICSFVSMFMAAKVFKSDDRKVKILAGIDFVLTTFIVVLLGLVLMLVLS